MARLVILIAVIAIALILWNKINKARGAERKKLVLWGIGGSVMAVLAVLAVTGHLNIITAAIAGVVAMAPKIFQAAKYLPFVSRLLAQKKQHEQQQTPPPQAKTAMSINEAMEILALEAGYCNDDVIQAHRRMMQKNHPDRGGSDYLAAKINKAKDTLLA